MSGSAPLALSLGDPAGIGPELVFKAWSALREAGPAFLVIGDADVLAAAGAPTGRVAAAGEASWTFEAAVPVLHHAVARPVTAGAPDPANAAAVIAWIETGVRLTQAGETAALVTGPIAKAALYEAGFRFPGHTEFIAHLTGAETPVMMLAGDSLKVALATIHRPLHTVSSALSIEGLVAAGRILDAALRRDFGIVRPRIAIAGLNPHAGEVGALGREEIETINPAAAQLRALGVDASDARPADTLFHPEARACYDAALAMYHDQGLIPLKTLHFWDAVNVTLGLPIVRTSPDHGTGFDIAGRGVARADSLIAALRLAAQMAARRAAA